MYDLRPLPPPEPNRAGLGEVPLLEAERWLAAIVESSDDAIIGESLDGTITSWNNGAERIFGYSATEAIGHPIRLLAWPGREEQMEELLLRVRSGERVDHFETTRKHKSGRRILVSVSMSPIIGPDGRMAGIAKIARDITDRVAMEESLSASTDQVRMLTEREAQARAETLAERRFRELIENAPDGILQVDQRGTILIANRTAEALFGYDSEELVGMSVDRLIPETHRSSHAANREAFERAGVARPMGRGLDLKGRRKDGAEFPVEISLSPVKVEGGTHVTAVIRDITDRRRTEEQVRSLQKSYMAELQARQKEAERLNRTKSEFLAGITHELRTPLHTIIGFADLLNEEMEGTLNATQKKFVAHIRTDSEHLLGLINDVLDLSRMEAGGLHIHTEQLSVDSSIEEAISAIRPHAEAKGIRLQKDESEREHVTADAMRLRQILYNLLGNAVKFTSPGGQVTVSSVPDGDWVQITVADDGVGIPAEEQANIFDRFYQVGYSSGGAGIGLAICKQLVQMHGGSISVDSEPGRGSKFHFTLPRAVAS